MEQTISVFGLGKLGCTMMACFAHKGWRVIGMDVVKNTVDKVNAGESPIFEPKVQDMIGDNKERITATTDPCQATKDADVIFIIVPTPSSADGSFSIDYVVSAATSIARAMRRPDDRYRVIVVTSTVLPGDMDKIREVLEKESGKKCGEDFGLCYNPDFIALGRIVHDFLNPDMILIGQSDDRAGEIVEGVHKRLADNNPTIHRMNWWNAELSKISLNSFCVTKISFANMLAEICEKMPGGDARAVAKAVGADSRVGVKYFMPGLPVAGPCVPPSTLVRTSCGLKRIDQIQKGDFVLTHEGRFRAVTEVFERPYNGPMVEIISMGFPHRSMLTTPDHPIWCSQRRSLDGKRYRTAGGKVRLSPIRGWTDPEFIKASDIEHGDCTILPIIREPIPNVLTPIEFQKRIHSKLPCSVALTPDIMRFFGFYVSEGCVWTKKGEIKFSLHQKETAYAKELVRIAKESFNAKASIKPHGGKGIKVKLCSKTLALFLKETFGCKSYEKRVPFEWLGLPESHLKELLRGICYGDGSRSTGVFTYGATSPYIDDFLQQSFLRLGIPFTTKIYKPRVGRDGVNHRMSYFIKVANGLFLSKFSDIFPSLEIKNPRKGSKTVWINGNNIHCTIRSVTEKKYNGTVWNLEVDEDNSYALESGVVHNCFPRDLRAFSHAAERFGVKAPLAEAVDNLNDYFKNVWIPGLIMNALREKGSDRLSVLGLTYKEDTTLVEEAISIVVLKQLSQEGVKITAYDPEGRASAERELWGMPGITFTNTVAGCLRYSSVCFVATPWPEFRKIKAGDFERYMDKDPVIIDAWNLYQFEKPRVRRIGRA
jgi:UDPglucose 6-dehydrogenase